MLEKVLWRKLTQGAGIGSFRGVGVIYMGHWGGLTEIMTLDWDSEEGGGEPLR